MMIESIFVERSTRRYLGLVSKEKKGNIEANLLIKHHSTVREHVRVIFNKYFFKCSKSNKTGHLPTPV